MKIVIQIVDNRNKTHGAGLPGIWIKCVMDDCGGGEYYLGMLCVRDKECIYTSFSEDIRLILPTITYTSKYY